MRGSALPRLLLGGLGALGLFMAGAACASDEHTVERSLDHGGIARTYRLHVPPGLDARKPAAVVLVFHGGGGNGKQVERYTRLSALSDREGFIAVYPDAVDGNWNDGRAVAKLRAQREKIDDVGFACAVLDALAKERAIDPKRVFATGISNGAFFSHRLAAERSERIAAIAPVVGGMAPAVAAAFAPAKPVSVLVIQGTEDPLVPYGGGTVARDRGELVDTAEALRLWAEHDACGKPAADEALPDAAPRDGTRIVRVRRSGGRDGTEVVLLRVDGGGHTWPGGRPYLPELVIGRTSEDLDATEEIWRFFAAHPRP
ncbi:MAG: prolyl oligopeptidase family serine peptidase [Actinobacteria bacterium]|nr:prolyl oligopeptidase family serine peptidase [Actinomycetota bacterium]